MARIRYCWVLPVVALAVYVSLIWFGCPYLQWARQRAQAQARQRQEGGSAFDPRCIDFAMPTAEQLADGLNAPATVAAGVLVLVPLDRWRHIECREAEYFGHAAVGFFVPFLWYFIGRGVDNRSTIRPQRGTRLVKFSAYVGMSVLSVIGVFVAAAIFFSPGDFLVLRVCVLGWIGFGIFVLFARARSGKTPVPHNGE